MPHKDQMDIREQEAKRVAEVFWFDLGELPEDRRPMSFAFVLSGFLDPNQPEAAQRQRIHEGTWGWENQNAAEKESMSIMEDAASHLFRDVPPEDVRKLLQARQTVWQNIKLATSRDELEQLLLERFLAGDNFVDVGYSWEQRGRLVGACFTQVSYIEPLF